MPETVQIGPLTFKVTVENLIGYDDEDQEVPIEGLCNVKNQEITIANRSEITQHRYLIHEMIEAYNELYDVQLKHPQINQMEMFIYDLILNNPELVKEIHNDRLRRNQGTNPCELPD